MIEAQDFVEAARTRGFTWWAGVPCSYLTPFINYVLQDEALRYVSMANEGDAVALIAGVQLGGSRGVTMMQNSGLGNAVSPLTSLTWTFQLPQLLIVTWRGQPGVPDEPQHALMGPVTPAMLETMDVAWELFPTEPAQIGPALERALAHMERTDRPYALVMQKNSVAPYPLKPGEGVTALRATVATLRPRLHAMDLRLSRQQVLRAVVDNTPSTATVVFASTGFCGRELYATHDRANHFYMVGSMGCVTPLALGLALARPDLEVLAIDGDGAALMRMGAFATVGAYGRANFKHLLLDNGAHDSTGGQATVSAGVSFAAIAAACGYADALDTDSLEDLVAWLRAFDSDGPHFARLMIRTGAAPDLPRPKVTPVEVKTRLMSFIASSAGALLAEVP